jgi:hypothetical protein
MQRPFAAYPPNSCRAGQAAGTVEVGQKRSCRSIPLVAGTVSAERERHATSD